MATVKSAELEGAALDWAAAKCTGYLRNIEAEKIRGRIVSWRDCGRTSVSDDDWTYWNPSEDWSQGGPIIEQEGILCGPSPFPNAEYAACIGSDWDNGVAVQTGKTPLIAAMRCVVAHKLGLTIEVPDELLKSEREPRL